jgi:hypothetical protein
LHCQRILIIDLCALRRGCYRAVQLDTIEHAGPSSIERGQYACDNWVQVASIRA